MTGRSLFLCGLAVASMAMRLPASAQDNQNYNSLIQNLVPPNGPDVLSFRGARLHSITIQKGLEGNATDTVNPSSDEFDVAFGPGATALSPAAKELIRQHQAEFVKPLPEKGFIVEGHTDSKGKPEVNVTISKRRAESVRDYIVQEFGLDPALVKVVGAGDEGLLDPNHPESDVNRRVHVAKLRP